MIAQSNPHANYLSHRTEIDAAIARVLASGYYILGKEVRQFEQDFAAAMQAEWSVGVASGTDALELSLRALGIGAGDSVLTVSHTAIATALAIHRIGAKPIFVDIEPDRYTMSPESLEAILATPQGRLAKGLIVVHLYGQMADMPALMTLARANGLLVIEDCAQAHGAMLQGRAAGSWGDLGCFSFYPTKNLGALGDGGAVVGQTTALQEALRLLREYGWRTRYVSDCPGYNSRLDEIQAAILNAKLPYLAADNARRRELADQYDRLLKGSAVRIPYRVSDGVQVFHQYVIEVSERDHVRAALSAAGVATLVHYPSAAHQQPAFADPIFTPVPLLDTEAVIPRILSLPMYPELAHSDIEFVSAQIHLISH